MINQSSTETGSLKAQFGKAATSLTAFYKNASALEEKAYNQGQQDATKEIFNYCFKISNGDLKKVDMGQLIGYIQDQIKELSAPCNNGPEGNNDAPTMNFFDKGIVPEEKKEVVSNRSHQDSLPRGVIPSQHNLSFLQNYNN